MKLLSKLDTAPSVQFTIVVLELKPKPNRTKASIDEYLIFYFLSINPPIYYLALSPTTYGPTLKDQMANESFSLGLGVFFSGIENECVLFVFMVKVGPRPSYDHLSYILLRRM